MNDNIWAIVPAYNEGKAMSDLLKHIKQIIDNIVVVDDGSKDNTAELAKKENVHVLQHIVNMGKGAALKTGCDFAIKNGAQLLIAIDADGQHDPTEIPKFIKEMQTHDIVFGYRHFNKRMPLILRLGNLFIGKSTELLFKIKLRDTQCGYRAYSAEAYKKLNWRSSDYSVESEMIANAGKAHLKYTEIPIQTIYSDKYKGTTFLDGIKIVWNMVLWKMGF